MMQNEAELPNWTRNTDAETCTDVLFYANPYLKPGARSEHRQHRPPLGTSRQYSADLPVAYLLTPVVQLDLGGNFGLDRSTPDAQVNLAFPPVF